MRTNDDAVSPTSPSPVYFSLNENESKRENENSVSRKNKKATSKKLSPTIIAKIGFELESSSVIVLPFVPKCTILIEGNGWNLETDVIPKQDVADLEFVVAPLSEMEEIDRIGNEIYFLVQKIRAASIQDMHSTVLFSMLAEGENLPYIVKPEFLEHRMVVRDHHVMARMQATYGLSLEKIEEYIISNSSSLAIEELISQLEKISDFYFKKNGKQLTPTARGLIALISFYINCANRKIDKYSTVHIFFRIMARSDFCAIYDKLLNDVDREQICSLFIADQDHGIPALMQALTLEENALLFKENYLDEKYQNVPGPTVKDWLFSIIYGRETGDFRKDLMSPPPGYRLHTGNLDVDYGMGAMGVDEINKLALFEIRFDSFRRDVPMNERLKQAMLREFIAAQEQNSLLHSFEVNWFAAVEKAHWAFNFYEGVFRKLQLLSWKIKNHLRTPDETTMVAILDEGIPAYRLALQNLESYLETQANVACYSELNSSLLKVAECVENIARVDVADFESAIFPFFHAYLSFERVLWDAENNIPAEIKKIA